MCGFSGILQFPDSSSNNVSFEEVLYRMNQTLVHRGPDDQGLWIGYNEGIGFAHNHLAVIDLSPGGHQPMHSTCGRYALVYDGEICNSHKLRAQLKKEGVEFEGTGDTRVLVEAISAWGLFKAVRKCNGMFAFALWDKLEQTLFLVRDRIEKKPLYYGWAGDIFIFASEINALRQDPRFSAIIDQGALTSFFEYSCMQVPYSIYKGIYKVMPGTIISITKGDLNRKTSVETLQERETVYWSARETAENSINNPFSGSGADAGDTLNNLFKNAAKCRMIADVPQDLTDRFGAPVAVRLKDELLDRAGALLSEDRRALMVFSIPKWPGPCGRPFLPEDTNCTAFPGIS